MHIRVFSAESGENRGIANSRVERLLKRDEGLVVINHFPQNRHRKVAFIHFVVQSSMETDIQRLIDLLRSRHLVTERIDDMNCGHGDTMGYGAGLVVVRVVPLNLIADLSTFFEEMEQTFTESQCA